MLKEGIKFRNKDVNGMITLRDTHEAIKKKFLNNDNNNDDTSRSTSRLEWGLILRECKELWVTALVLASVVVAAAANNNDKEQEEEEKVSRVVVERTKQCYKEIVEIHALDQCWKTKPLMDGRAIIKVLGLPRNGPKVGEYMKEQIKWMLQYPHGTREELEAYLLLLKQLKS